jgi:hypothetical protein
MKCTVCGLAATPEKVAEYIRLRVVLLLCASCTKGRRP